MMRRSLSFAMLAVLLCLGGLLARADNNARIVRLSLVDGTVQVDRRDGGGLENAIVNMPVVEGAEIRTEHDGYAELEFERGSTVRLTPGTTLRVLDLGRFDDGLPYTTLELLEGVAYFDVDKNEAAGFRVTAAGQSITLRRNARFRLEASPQAAELAVLDGKVEVSGSTAGNATVGKNQTLHIDRYNGDRYEIAHGTNTYVDDSWDQERSSYRDRYSHSSSPYRGYSTDYVWGFDDLNYWGNYTYVSGWGWLWRPYNAAYTWYPFANGAWVWYPGWGWTWVSTYPWGWTPYRYGNWMWVQSYGWCWRPSNTWSSWHAVPPPVLAGPGTRVPTPRISPPPTPPRGNRGMFMVNDQPLPRWHRDAPGSRPSTRFAIDRPEPGMPGGRPAADAARTPARGGFSTGGANASPAPNGGVARPAAPARDPDNRINRQPSFRSQPATPNANDDGRGQSRWGQSNGPSSARPDAPAPQRMDSPAAPSHPAPQVDRPAPAPQSNPRMDHPAPAPRSTPPPTSTPKSAGPNWYQSPAASPSRSSSWSAAPAAPPSSPAHDSAPSSSRAAPSSSGWNAQSAPSRAPETSGGSHWGSRDSRPSHR